MGLLNETKEKMGVVKSVGGFANALQQIAAMRMTLLRDKVLSSKRFVNEAAQILKELSLYQESIFKKEYEEALKRSFKNNNKLLTKERVAVIIITSNQGLCGKYNAEVFKRVEGSILKDNKNSDIFVVGKKGQEHYLTNKKFDFKFYPYNLPDNFEYTDLLRLVEMFPIYNKIVLVFSRYINTINREVVETLLVMPSAKSESDDTMNLELADLEKIKYIFEPSLEELIHDVSSKLRAATFQQQILDSRLAQFSAQMVGMQAASENAKVLLGDLQHEYNKQRRKQIDKKIAEVLGGSTLW